eukprot:c8530_g1_i1 orf=3-173(-)
MCVCLSACLLVVFMFRRAVNYSLQRCNAGSSLTCLLDFSCHRSFVFFFFPGLSKDDI